MAVEMYKGLMGWVEYKPNDEKHTPTHRLLTDEEYEDLLWEIESLKTGLKEKDAYYSRVIGIKKQSTLVKIQEVRSKAEEQVTQVRNELMRQRGLVENLLRISRERANADRHLQPKKKHDGYRLVGKVAQTQAVSGYVKGQGATYETVWTANLETPYHGTVPLEMIEYRIYQDLSREDGILDKMHIRFLFDDSDPGRIRNGSYQDAPTDEKNNFLFQYRFMVNTQTQLWEMQILTTREIQVTSDMLG